MDTKLGCLSLAGLTNRQAALRMYANQILPLIDTSILFYIIVQITFLPRLDVAQAHRSLMRAGGGKM